jgi:hypothetical protein
MKGIYLLHEKKEIRIFVLLLNVEIKCLFIKNINIELKK